MTTIPLSGRSLSAVRLLCAVALVLFAALSAALSAAPASAAPYAALVMDMRTGKVVHSRSADRRQHPASLTKMMTLYLAFEALQNGQLRLDQRLRVSRHASRQPASKLYLKAGQRVTVRHLLRATAIKSANDAAMVLAEAIGGSQRGFATLMTRKARALGMGSTTFKNPHGLTQAGHLSTARDMARLARHLYFDFPQYYNLFGRKTARAAGKRLYNTNRLLSSYRGAEGLKTGYTRAAGFNLVATAKRGQRRVIAVVMGGKSSRSRNARVAELLDLGFRKTPARAAEIPPSRAAVQIARAPVPQARPGTSATGLAAIGAALASPAAAATPPATALSALRSQPRPVGPASRHAPAAAPEPRRSPRAVDVAALVATPARGSIPEAVDARKVLAEVEARIIARDVEARLVSGSGVVSEVPVPMPRPGWQVQVAAYRDPRSARLGLERFRLAQLPMLEPSALGITQGRSRSGRAIYTVRAHGMDRDEAVAACRRLKKSGRDCLTVPPG